MELSHSTGVACAVTSILCIAFIVPAAADDEIQASAAAAGEIQASAAAAGEIRPPATASDESGTPDDTRLFGDVTCTPCEGPEVPAGAWCGTYEVYEDREAAAGRTIALRLMILPASGPDVAPDPVFIIAGGPGQSAVEMASFIASHQAATLRARDIVFVDQRGTGGSNPLPCVLDKDAGIGRYIGPSAPVEDIEACRDELARRADLGLYTTPIAVDDFDEVRRALGYDRINLDGGSYGTRVALVYMRRHPHSIRSAVLSGVNSTDFRLPLPFARGAEDALAGIFEQCAADSACQNAFPELESEFRAVLERLEAGPVTVEATNPDTGKREPVELTRDLFATRLHLMLFPVWIARQVPYLLHQCYEGDFETFTETAILFGKAVIDQIYYGMQLSVACSEDFSRITVADVARETDGTWVGDAWFDGFFDYCEAWGSGELPAGYFEPIESGVPTLLLSGELDPSTPPRFAREVERHLAAATRIEIAGATHIFPNACIEAIRAEFIERGGMDGVDTSCVGDIELPPFSVPAP